MDIDNIQTILENYKNALQDEEDSDDKQKTTNQYIQKLVYQTLKNILTKDQKKSLKKEKYFSYGTLGHFTAQCPRKPNFKALLHSKTYKAKKNLITKKTKQKRDLIKSILEEPMTDFNSDKEEENFFQSD